MIAGWIAALSVALAWSAGALAEEWPVRPITMVIPFAAGGTSSAGSWRSA